MAKTAVAVQRSTEIAPWKEGDRARASVTCIRRMIEALLRDLGGIDRFVSAGQTVFIKPNLVAPEPPWTAVNTDPRVIEALVAILIEAGARRVVVGEHQRWHGADIFTLTGVGEAAERAGAEVVALDDLEHITVAIPDGECERWACLPRIVVECDVLVNVPKMKTHLDTQVSLCLKNLMGLIPSDPHCLRMHGRLAQSLADLYGSIKPKLNIVDGLMAMEGHGPLFGSPVRDMNMLVAGENGVAVDSVCSTLMGFDAREIDSNRVSAARGLGPADLAEIDVIGADIGEIKRAFARAIPSPLAYARYDGYAYPVEVHLGTSCKGCEGPIREQLDQLTLLAEIEGIPFADRRPLVIIAGRNACVPDRLPADAYVWVVGDCAADHRAKGYYTGGCPLGAPNPTLGPECIGFPLTWPVMGRLPSSASS